MLKVCQRGEKDGEGVRAEQIRETSEGHDTTITPEDMVENRP
jgi:hypothetical protein